MKRILVPTDFSECADYAVQVALDFAKKSKAEIHFLHLMSIPIDWINMNSNQEKMYPDITKKVKKVNVHLDELVEKAEKGGISAKRYIHYSERYINIIDHIEKYDCDFIVMGSHGTSGVKELFIGSTTQKIVRLSSAPVFVVKSTSKPLKLSKIIFASDFQKDMLTSFEHVLDFAKLNNAKLHLLYLVTPLNFIDTEKIKNRMSIFKGRAGALLDTSEIYNCFDIEEGLKKYSNQINADALAMVTHGRRSISRLIAGSFTENVINHLDIPVLSININN